MIYVLDTLVYIFFQTPYISNRHIINKHIGISHLHIDSHENWLFTHACNHINSS